VSKTPPSQTPVPKITAVRTLRLAERPKLLWLEVETDDGRTGLGETFRGAEAAEAALHELIAPGLIGRDARRIATIANDIQNPYVGYHSAGAEVRAASALDIALWDLAGQRQGVPIHEALGGAARDVIPVYNTCAGYDFNTRQGDRRRIGEDDAVVGPYDDQVAFTRDAGALAQSLLSEGYKAMKIWPFDQFAHAPAHNHLSGAQIREGLRAFEQVRAAVGHRIDIMCELHSLFDATTALAICQALEPFDVRWVEDPISKMDDARALADLRRRSRVPICASETLSGPVAYRDLLAADAVDYVMLDLVWCGGFTGARKISALAEAYARPMAPHDCTGPIALWAGIHFALHATTAVYQEVVRASLATWYGDIVDHLPAIVEGCIGLPTGAGLGVRLKDSFRSRADLTVRETRS